MKYVSLLARFLVAVVFCLSLVPNGSSFASSSALNQYAAPDNLPALTGQTLPDGQFQVRQGAPTSPAPAASSAACTTPAAVTLVAPANHAGVTTLAPAFTFNTVSGVTDYLIDISKAADFSTKAYSGYWYSPLNQQTIFIYVNLQANTKYYWRVAGYCQDTHTTGPYTVFDFTVGNVPSNFISPPAIITPAEGAKLPAGNFTATWGNVSGANGVKYTFYTSLADYQKGTFALMGVMNSWYTGVNPYADWLAPATIYLTIQVRNQNGWGPATATPRVFSLGTYAYDLKFRPNPDGYNFKNIYSNYPSSGKEISQADMINLFGAAAVCKVTSPNCVLKSQASAWLEKANYLLNSGHCLGESSTALNYFKNPSLIGGVQSGKTATYQLAQASAHRKIDLDHILQLTQPLDGDRNSAVNSATPKSVVETLEQSFAGGGSDPYVLILVRSDWKASHAVVPYAVVVNSPTDVHILVYDNEFPNESKREILINPDPGTNSWSYNLSSNANLWQGSAAKNSIGLVALSKFKQTPTSYNTAPRLNRNLTFASANSQVWGDGLENMWVTDGSGNRLGYISGALYTEITGAQVDPVIGDIDTERLPLLNLPSGTYTIHLDGSGSTSVTDGWVSQSGNGFAAQANHINLSGTASDTFTVASDGSQAAYTASESHSVELSLNVDLAAGTGSISAGDLSVGAGQSVRLVSDPVAQVFKVNNSLGGDGSYDLNLHIRTASGDRWFYHPGLAIQATDTEIFSYGGWDGNDIVMSIDYGSNGSIDSTINLTNNITRVFLPLVTRP